MKKLVLILLVLFCLPAMALAETISTEPYTWQSLATIAGVAAFTLLVVEFFKAPLDKIWKIPTRVVVYVISLAVMLVANAFTVGLTFENGILAAVNAMIAALTAMGAYEVTFAKVEAKPPEKME